MMTEQWTLGQLIDALREDELNDENTLDTINRWLDRGDGVAVYTNQDLGHPMLGDRKYVSFGSHASQLETDDPPTTLPDLGSQINWRYQLTATHRPERTVTP